MVEKLTQSGEEWGHTEPGGSKVGMVKIQVCF